MMCDKTLFNQSVVKLQKKDRKKQKYKDKEKKGKQRKEKKLEKNNLQYKTNMIEIYYYVLPNKVVTLETSQLETSLLNTDAI